MSVKEVKLKINYIIKFEECNTIDMIFTLRQLQEKIRKQHSSLYAMFIDLRKAFDITVRHHGKF